MAYGVQPTGYVRKPLSVILAELEAAMTTEFGPGVIQTPQSPLGQLNGLMADLIAELWELAEDVYQSYDPDQAEGSRLDILGRLRLVRRAGDESDSTLRGLITNQSTARINLADLLRAVKNIDGVTYSQVFVNETSENDQNGMPRNTVAVAALGGADDEIADAITQYLIPGISTFGNTEINTFEDGFCRSLRLIRPVQIPTDLVVGIRFSPDRLGCPAPSPAAVEANLLAYLTSPDHRPRNGQDITAYFVRSYLESQFPNTVEVVYVSGFKNGVEVIEGTGVPFEFLEIADVKSIEVVPS